MGFESFRQLLSSLDREGYTVVPEEGGTDNVTVRFSLNSPASNYDIKVIEGRLSKRIPDSLKEFLLNWNGGEIYNAEYLGGFRLFGTGELLERNNSLQGVYGRDWEDDILVVAVSFGDGDHIGVNVNTGRILDAFHEGEPNEWLEKVIAESFGDWINKLVEAHGHRYWLGI